ncbi:MAG TPA: HAD-IA family hydrolase [Methylomirabilota bacterium]|nr:HAD-IA family hydrolase [Methylomirabilota bacterium]
MNLPELALEHIGLAAADTTRLKDWYVKALGAKVIFENKETPPAYLVQLAGGALLEIYAAHHALDGKSNNRSSGLRHLALRVGSIDAARHALSGRGVKFTEEVKPAGGGGKVLFFQDPEGNLLHLVERTGTEIRFPEVGRHQKRFAAVIFDMDGVIIDSEPRHELAFRQIFDEMGYGHNHGIHFPDYYGRSDRALWVDFIQKHQPNESLEHLMEWKQRRFLDLIEREQPIFPEVPALVAKLAAAYPLALASGSYHPVINVVLGMKNLRPHFRAVVSAQDVVHGKPAPDIFLRAAELLQVDPADCCVIEDSVAGVTAAKAAGMTAIGITNSVKADQLAHADHVCSAYREIEAILGI